MGFDISNISEVIEVITTKQSNDLLKSDWVLLSVTNYKTDDGYGGFECGHSCLFGWDRSNGEPQYPKSVEGIINSQDH